MPKKSICQTSLEFKSRDGLLISADCYPAKPERNVLLCHQSHCNRGEYRETAPRLAGLGFSCIAIDQRSGMNVFGVVNEPSTRAKHAGVATGYLDARQDIEAAVDFACRRNGGKPIVLFGSSYSAALALWIAACSDKIAAVVSFSPGEHLKGVRLSEALAPLFKPVFATGALREINEVKGVLKAVQRKWITLFEPTVEGFHGSKALWS